MLDRVLFGSSARCIIEIMAIFHRLSCFAGGELPRFISQTEWLRSELALFISLFKLPWYPALMNSIESGSK